MTNIAPGHGGKERNPATLGNHRFFDGSHEEMLRKGLILDTALHREGEKIRVTVSIRAENVGHRVPTGYIDRHLILVVQGTDAAGEPVTSLEGPTLPSPAGILAGQAGRLFGRVLSDPEGHQPAPFWRSQNDVVDTRLWPERTSTSAWSFPLPLRRVRVRLIYRRFWEKVSRTKGWPLTETVVRETTLTVPSHPSEQGILKEMGWPPTDK
jgi:hypothetical protein